MNKSLQNIPEWLKYKYTRGLRTFVSRYRIEPVFTGSVLASLYSHYIDAFYNRSAENTNNDYIEFDKKIIAEDLRTDELLIIRRLEYINRQDYGHYIKDGKTVALFKITEEDGKTCYLINIPMLDTIQAERNSKVNQLILPVFFAAILGASLPVLLSMIFK